jgi:CheY-like chemotaxis protein
MEKVEEKRILIIEDNLFELENISKVLKNEGYSVNKVANTAKADDLLEKHNDKPFDCLIIDLNMNNGYLSKELKSKTYGGALTGWVWLYDIVKTKRIVNNPKIIIYSEFISELEECINNENNVNEEERDYFYNSKKVKTLSKADVVNNPELLLEEVNKLLGKKERQA